MNQYLNHLIALFRRLLFLLIIFTVLRLGFFVFNIKSFLPGSAWGIIKVFIFGIRFDFIVIFYLNLLFILLHLVPGRFKDHSTYQKALRYLFVIVNAIVISANFIDIEYFKFSNHRSGTELLKLLTASSDTMNLLPHYISNYWHILISWIITVWLMWELYPHLHYSRFRIEINNTLNIIMQPLIAIIIAVIFFGFARGLETKPIRINTVHKYSSPKNIPLLLNTPFVIINTIGQKDLIKADYFDHEYAENIYSPVRDYAGIPSFNNQNVVIIILESFSGEYVGALNPALKGFTPFLDSLINNSLIFDNALANANRSMDALPAILSSLPSLDGRTFITSIYSTNKLASVSNLLSRKGYHTSFFHGGKNGTMGFDYFCKSIGIEEYYGESEYPDKGDYDGAWGIYDEPFFQFFAGKLNQFKQPFISAIFSLSSHEPYPIPEKYNNKFPESKYEILSSIAYTDYSLRKFFDTVSKYDWYKNTLFVICADHTSMAIDRQYGTQVGRYRIPVIYFHPYDNKLKGINHKVTQQIDILPSVLDYLHYGEKFVSFGQSVFDNKKESLWYCYNRGSYYIADSVFCLIFDGNKSIELYNYKKDSLLQSNIISEKPDITKKLEISLKAILQNYQYRMERNLMADTVGMSEIGSK